MKRNAAFWWITLATTLALAATSSLGFWQLRRAAAKEAIASAILEKNTLEVLVNKELFATKNIANLFHRQTLLRGQWRAADTVFLENRQMNGVPGFVVVTPLQLVPQGPLVLVQRGWVQRDFLDRTHLPNVLTPSGDVDVKGRFAPPPSKVFEPPRVSGGPAPALGLIRQNVDVEEMAQRTALPVLAASVLQTGESDEGLQRSWPAPNLGVEKHYAYAAQWFALSALLLGLYAWFQWIAPYVRTRRTESPS